MIPGKHFVVIHVHRVYNVIGVMKLLNPYTLVPQTLHVGPKVMDIAGMYKFVQSCIVGNFGKH